MRNFQDILETRKRSFISAFSICVTVPLSLICDLKVICKLYNNKCMIASTQIRNTEIFSFIAVLLFKVL